MEGKRIKKEAGNCDAVPAVSQLHGALLVTSAPVVKISGIRNVNIVAAEGSRGGGGFVADGGGLVVL